MDYSIGDRVRFMDFDAEGTVTAVCGPELLEVEVDGMRMRAHCSEVVATEAASNEQEREMYGGNGRISRYKPCAGPPRAAVRSGRKAARMAETMEVDLHIDKIRQRYPAARNVPEGDVLYIQLDVFDKSMAEAFRRGVRSVVFIHGNGRGVLRRELERRLRDYPGVTASDASPLRYGSGAMEVFIK